MALEDSDDEVELVPAKKVQRPTKANTKTRKRVDVDNFGDDAGSEPEPSKKSKSGGTKKAEKAEKKAALHASPKKKSENQKSVSTDDFDDDDESVLVHQPLKVVKKKAGTQAALSTPIPSLPTNTHTKSEDVDESDDSVDFEHDQQAEEAGTSDDTVEPIMKRRKRRVVMEDSDQEPASESDVDLGDLSEDDSLGLVSGDVVSEVLSHTSQTLIRVTVFITEKVYCLEFSLIGETAKR